MGSDPISSCPDLLKIILVKSMDGMKIELSNQKEENKKLNEELAKFQNEEVMRLNSIQITY